MTDFIHERPREEQPNAAHTADELPMDEKTGQKRVYGYIFILFIVAFGLLVWSFLMNQRGTDQVLSELRGNADALQATLTRNVELERQADALQGEIDALEAAVREREQEIDRLKGENTDEQRRSAAREMLWLLEYRFAREEYGLCRETARELEAYRGALQTEAADGVPSELTRYEEIVAALAVIEAESSAENDTVSRETN